MDQDESKYLTDLLDQSYYDPLYFVEAFFPWGEEGTWLQKHSGPVTWQIRILKLIGKLACEGVKIGNAIQIAVASGHGIGKTTLISWILLWFISTRLHPQIIVTANTKEQIMGKTWRELSKWHKVMLHSPLYECTATRFSYLPEKSTWFAAAIAWSKEKSEAFQGAHEENILVLFDEASAIDPIIWEVVNGAMSTEGSMWIAFGNPTQNSGGFYDCFKRNRKYWYTEQISSWDSEMVNRQWLEQMRDQWGEDDDRYRIRVSGQFPSQSVFQFISLKLVEAAAARVIHPKQIEGMPLIMGVDVARQGDDDSVIVLRQGLLVREIERHHGLNTVELADVVAQRYAMWQPDGCFVDGVGIGAGVVDILQTKLKVPVVEVQAGSKSTKNIYNNKRTEMWGDMKEWLEAGASIPDKDQALIDDLIGPMYDYGVNGKMKLERKKDMKLRGVASPDAADAISMTFCSYVHKEQDTSTFKGPYDLNRYSGAPERKSYDPYGRINKLAKERTDALRRRMRR